MPRSPAATTALVDRLEETQTIRFHKASGHEAEGPRVGLFHAPGAGPRQNYEPAHAGHYWELEPQNEEDLPGAK